MREYIQPRCIVIIMLKLPSSYAQVALLVCCAGHLIPSCWTVTRLVQGSAHHLGSKAVHEGRREDVANIGDVRYRKRSTTLGCRLQPDGAFEL